MTLSTPPKLVSTLTAPQGLSTVRIWWKPTVLFLQDSFAKMWQSYVDEVISTPKLTWSKLAPRGFTVIDIGWITPLDIELQRIFEVTI